MNLFIKSLLKLFLTCTLLLSHADSNSHISINSRVPRSTELLDTISNSEFIAIGSVKKREPIGKRISSEELIKLDDLSKTLGGYLYKFQIESLICAKTDLKAGMARPSLNKKTMYIFKKRDTRFFREEFYEVNRRYLMFFTPLTNQDNLSKEYILEKQNTYYEAYGGKKGLIQLTDNKNPLLHRLNSVCNALKPKNKELKINRLKLLLTSPDSEISETSQELVKMLREPL